MEKSRKDWIKDKGSADSFNLSIGRGKFLSELANTPVRGAANVGSPDHCSTRAPGNVAPSPSQGVTSSGLPDMTDPVLINLITHIAQQVGQTIRDQLRVECEDRDVKGTQAQSSVSQIPSDSTYLNLIGTKLVLQSDVREPPVFRGVGSDKNTVCEWEELMEVYLNTRATPPQEQYSEIMSKLMGKAKDAVRITLRSSSPLKPQENPKIIYDILRQHFSDVTYSCMPMADFYSTVPAPGETPVDYWLCLNKAVDAAEEGPKRLGRHMEDPCQEAAMMFKYCPDPTLTANFTLKTPDKWTASEVQERIDRYQLEMKEHVLSKSKHPRPVTAQVQTPALDDSRKSCHLGESPVQNESLASSNSPCNEKCLQVLVRLFENVLSQKSNAAHKPVSPGQFQQSPCRVCNTTEHSTLAHCRQKRLCLACFEPNHLRRNCPNRKSDQARSDPPPQNTQPLN